MTEGLRRPTMVDIARRLGVSQATVSLALNQAPGTRISQATRKRVLELARELGYRRPQPAERGGRTIGLLLDHLTTSQHALPLIEGARDEAAAHDCQIAVVPTRGDPEVEADALDFLTARPLVGVIYATLLTQAVAPPERLRELRTVLLNCHATGDHYPTVVPGDVAGAFAATAHLAEAGHRCIGLINGEDWLEASRDRLKGYRQALATFDAPLDPRLVVPGGTAPNGRHQAERLLALPRPPTAIFCFSDRMALGAYEAAAARGLRVPEDLSVIGFDNEAHAVRMHPPLTTVTLPHEEMARWAVARLIEALDLETAPRRTRRVKIDCPLVVRGSVASLSAERSDHHR